MRKEIISEVGKAILFKGMKIVEIKKENVKKITSVLKLESDKFCTYEEDRKIDERKVGQIYEIWFDQKRVGYVKLESKN